MSKLQLLTTEIFVPEDARNRFTTDIQVMASIRHLVRKESNRKGGRYNFFLARDKALRHNLRSPPMQQFCIPIVVHLYDLYMPGQ